MSITIKEVKNNKKRYIDLLLLADEQENMIDEYLERGQMFVLKDNEDVIAEAVVTYERPGVYELKNLATNPEFQKKGYARMLVKYIFENIPDYKTIYVGIGDGTEAVSFYEKCGFTKSHKVENFFTDNCDKPIIDNGIQLVDMLYLKKDKDDDIKKGQKPDSFYQNASKPVGEDGKSILNRMNRSHAQMAEWGQSHLEFNSNDSILDIGCGGGANLAVFLKKAPNGQITGIDYSDVSVEESTEYNKVAVDEGRCKVLKGDVSNLPFDDNSFDIITGFETVYFWPQIEDAFKQVLRVLKPGCTFLVCNETDDKTNDTYARIIKGMTIYEKEEIRDMMVGAGFKNVKAHTHQTEEWICVTATK